MGKTLLTEIVPGTLRAWECLCRSPVITLATKVETHIGQYEEGAIDPLMEAIGRNGRVGGVCGYLGRRLWAMASSMPLRKLMDSGAE